MLELRRISVAYGAVQALRSVSLTAPAGQITAIVGANGAGKSTCLKLISGLVSPSDGEVLFEGEPITRLSPERRRGLGVAHVMEGRRFFGDQSVQANLELGAYARLRRGDGRRVAEDISEVYGRFPALAEKRHLLAATLSGGQQQMLVIAMALVARPKLLLLDEPSLGLAPKIVEEVFGIVRELNRAGHTVVLVEQMASLALQIADSGYIFERGQVAAHGPAVSLLRGEDARRLSDVYLGRAQ